MGQLLRRTWILAIAATLLAGLVGAPSALAQKKKAPVLTVTLVDARQAVILKRGAVRVRVTSRRAGRFRVTLKAGRKHVAGKTVRWSKRGTKTVRLRLSKAGRRTMGSCVRRRLTARVRRARKGKARAFVRTTYQRDAKRCRGAKDPAPTLVAGTIGSGLAPQPGGSPGSGSGSSTSPGGVIGADGKPRTTDKLPDGAYGSPENPSDRCDPLDPAVCLYPFPNDHFTVADDTTATKRRLNLSILSMPRSVSNKPIDPRDQNRNDGFSPGNLIVTRIPGLDNPAAFAKTGAVPITDMARTDDKDQPVVVINTRTSARHLIWAEIDSNPEDPKNVTLIIRPGVNFEEGTRYVVALRNLKDKDGKTLAARDAFRFYRDDILTTPKVDDFEARRPAMERIFRDLAKAGIPRDDLYLAWDFTVASERNLSERILQIRDDAFKQLGDTNLADRDPTGTAPRVVVNPNTPDEAKQLCDEDGLGQVLGETPELGCQADFKEVDGVRDHPPCSDGDPTRCEQHEDDRIMRSIRGQVTVPCYLDQPGCPPGSRFAYASVTGGTPSALPNNTTTANFICNIPRRFAAAGAPQLRPGIYGHGLLGGAGEVFQGQLKDLQQEHGFMFCATDWIGMSTYDLPNIASLLGDLSNFSTLTDRVQQGMVNFMYVGRAMINPAGMCAQDAFKVNGRCALDTQPKRLYYDGNSQGGIIGGALAAVAPDYDRAVLGVPGMNYSTLLRRSVDFDMYAQIMYNAYPNELERPLLLSVIQLLWDRAEANGYAHHMTKDPYANTPPHEVLFHVGYGDHQVANVSAEVEARTVGAATNPNPLDPGRSPDVAPLFGIPRIGAFPYAGSAYMYWDIGPLRNNGAAGTPSPPTGNVPPRAGKDPHEAPRRTAAARVQKDAFLRDGGLVIDPCNGRPCYSDGFTGSGG